MTSSSGVEKISFMHTDMNQIEYQFEALHHERVIYFAILPAAILAAANGIYWLLEIVSFCKITSDKFLFNSRCDAISTPSANT